MIKGWGGEERETESSCKPDLDSMENYNKAQTREKMRNAITVKKRLPVVSRLLIKTSS